MKVSLAMLTFGKWGTLPVCQGIFWRMTDHCLWEGNCNFWQKGPSNQFILFNSTLWEVTHLCIWQKKLRNSMDQDLTNMTPVIFFWEMFWSPPWLLTMKSYWWFTLQAAYPAVRHFTRQFNRLPGRLISLEVWCICKVWRVWPLIGHSV